MMSCSSDKFIGRDVAVYYSLQDDCDSVPVDFVRLGALRGKDFGTEWENVDVTADTSEGQVKQYLATFKDFNPSFDGLVSKAADDNQSALELHVNNPPEASGYQPSGWIRIVRPLATGTTRTYELPVLFTSFSLSAPYAEAVTMNLATQSRGAVTITDV